MTRIAGTTTLFNCIPHKLERRGRHIVHKHSRTRVSPLSLFAYQLLDGFGEITVVQRICRIDRVCRGKKGRGPGPGERNGLGTRMPVVGAAAAGDVERREGDDVGVGGWTEGHFVEITASILIVLNWASYTAEVDTCTKTYMTVLARK